MELIEAYYLLKREGKKDTLLNLSTLTGMNVNRVKKIKSRLVKEGRWPGSLKREKVPDSIRSVVRILKIKYGYKTIQKIIKEKYNLEIPLYTLPKICNKNLPKLKVNLNRVHEEALKEYRTRHDPERLWGTPVEELISECRR